MCKMAPLTCSGATRPRQVLSLDLPDQYSYERFCETVLITPGQEPDIRGQVVHEGDIIDGMGLFCAF